MFHGAVSERRDREVRTDRKKEERSFHQSTVSCQTWKHLQSAWWSLQDLSRNPSVSLKLSSSVVVVNTVRLHGDLSRSSVSCVTRRCEVRTRAFVDQRSNSPPRVCLPKTLKERVETLPRVRAVLLRNVNTSNDLA